MYSVKYRNAQAYMWHFKLMAPSIFLIASLHTTICSSENRKSKKSKRHLFIHLSSRSLSWWQLIVVFVAIDSNHSILALSICFFLLLFFQFKFVHQTESETAQHRNEISIFGKWPQTKSDCTHMGFKCINNVKFFFRFSPGPHKMWAIFIGFQFDRIENQEKSAVRWPNKIKSNYQ